MLALSLLADLAIEHQIGRPGVQRRPVQQRQIQALVGAALPVRVGAIEARRLVEHARGDQRAEQGAPRHARPRNHLHREEPLVCRRFDDLVAVQLERARAGADKNDRDRHRDAGDPTRNRACSRTTDSHES